MIDLLLIGERVILRPISHEDADLIWAVSRVPGFTDGMEWNPAETIEEVHAFIDAALADWETGETYTWIMEEKENGSAVGCIALRETEKDDVYGIGYWVHPDHQGKGYATDAASEVTRYAFEDLQAATMLSSHAPWNEASGKVLRNIGMVHTGFTPSRFLKNGEPFPAEEYRLERSTWLERKRE